MRSIVGVDLAMFWGGDILAAVPLDGNLTKEEHDKPCGSIFQHSTHLCGCSSALKWATNTQQIHEAAVSAELSIFSPDY